MFDPIILKLTNQIAREGITDETSSKLISLADTLLNVDDLDKINISNIQTLLLLLQDFEIIGISKRLIEELRFKIIRSSLGVNWQHGVVTAEYTLNEVDKQLTTNIDRIQVYEDGAISKEAEFSIQPLIAKDRWLLNDYGQAAINN